MEVHTNLDCRLGKKLQSNKSFPCRLGADAERKTLAQDDVPAGDVNSIYSKERFQVGMPPQPRGSCSRSTPRAELSCKPPELLWARLCFRLPRH